MDKHKKGRPANKWADFLVGVRKLAAVVEVEGHAALKHHQLPGVVDKATEVVTAALARNAQLETLLTDLAVTLAEMGEPDLADMTTAAISERPEVLDLAHESDWRPVSEVVRRLYNCSRNAWGSAFRLKYLGLRIDTRDMHCSILDRYGEPVGISAIEVLEGATERMREFDRKLREQP